VAYHGATQLGFADSKTQLYKRCLSQGLKPGDFLVRSVELTEPLAAEVLFDN
jgi:hypothetical protein